MYVTLVTQYTLVRRGVLCAYRTLHASMLADSPSLAVYTR